MLRKKVEDEAQLVVGLELAGIIPPQSILGREMRAVRAVSYPRDPDYMLITSRIRKLHRNGRYTYIIQTILTRGIIGRIFLVSDFRLIQFYYKSQSQYIHFIISSALCLWS